jgi:hypothetical protein
MSRTLHDCREFHTHGRAKSTNFARKNWDPAPRDKITDARNFKPGHDMHVAIWRRRQVR